MAAVTIEVDLPPDATITVPNDSSRPTKCDLPARGRLMAELPYYDF